MSEIKKKKRKEKLKKRNTTWITSILLWIKFPSLHIDNYYQTHENEGLHTSPILFLLSFSNNNSPMILLSKIINQIQIYR